MNPKYRRYLKYVVLIVVFVVAEDLTLSLWHERDSEAKNSREYLAEEPAILAKIGGINQVEFKQKLVYHGTSTDPGYIQFTYYLSSVHDENYLVRVRKYNNNTSYQVHELQKL